MTRIEELYYEIVGRSVSVDMPPKLLATIHKHTLRHLEDKWAQFTATFDEERKESIILDFLAGYAAGLVDSVEIRKDISFEITGRKTAKDAAERN